MISRWFWREWRSPSLLIVWLALSLAVACVLALGSVSDRMEKGLSQQSREFMAGDRALQSSRDVPPAWIEEARKLGLKSVAEGVEDEATWRVLAQLGCDLCQGFFSARPMPRSELANWHRTWQDRLPTLISI